MSSLRVPVPPVLLAGLNVVMVVVALGIALRGTTLQDDALAARAEADEDAARVGDLQALATALSGPGNDVFVDLAVEQHRRRFLEALVEYEGAYDGLTRERRDARFLQDLASIDDTVAAVSLATESVCRSVEEGDPTAASAAMVELDRTAAALSPRFELLRRHDVDERALAEREIARQAHRLVDFGWVLGAGVGLVAAILLLHTLREHQERLRAEEERQRLLVDLERARVEAEAANRAKSEFLANMSHEIRTPMTAILGYADLLLDSAQGPQERLECVQTIRRNGGHLLQLVNDILDLSKIEAGRLEVEEVVCDPGAMVAEVASLMQVRAAERSVAFEVAYATPMPSRVTTDPLRLRQILLNLVGNALKFTERGSVRLVGRCDRDHRTISFEVVDTGPGMDADTLSRLFRPFTQADTSTTRLFGGTGLGLTISRRLARLLGGDIDVRSTPGEGSSFTVRVATGPLDDAGFSSTPSQRSVEPVRPGRPTKVRGRILLAEDGPDNQRLIVAILRIAGAEVDVVDNGKSAVDRALDAAESGNAYDLILMDMQMPTLDGYGATSYLRSRGYRGPIVALTAHAMSGDREKCVRAGCDDHETKPVDRTSLLQTVARFLPKVEPVERAGPDPMTPLESSYAADPDMEPLIAEFMAELPLRLTEIEAAAARSDRAHVRRVAHQLRGAGGAYGYAAVTDVCRVLEEAAGRAEVDLERPVADLRVLIRRISMARAA